MQLRARSDDEFCSAAEAGTRSAAARTAAMTADKFITPASPERVSLADAYFHFRATGSRSDRQAIIDLSAAIRSGKLGELIAGKTTELRAGGAKPRNDFNQPIPAEALADRLGMTFDFELSKGEWKIRLREATLLSRALRLSAIVSSPCAPRLRLKPLPKILPSFSKTSTS